MMNSNQTNPVAFAEAFRFWVKLGLINFGGPAGQIALMHRELVEQKRWVSDELFFRALNFCMLLPGPEATQLAVYIGWRLHGTPGGIIAGTFFILPSVFVLLALSYLAVAGANIPAIAGLLYGVQPVVIAIVVEAVWRIGRRTLHNAYLVAFAALAFGALYFLRVPFPLIIAIAALAGVLLQAFVPTALHSGANSQGGAPADESPNLSAHRYPPLSRTLKLVGLYLALLAIPIGAILFTRGATDVLMDQALFFTQAAFITFGGAYAVLSYMADMAVNYYHWLDTSQMVIGLGLAESTPGPLIMVTQYVGFLGAWKFAGDANPWLYGILGALVTTYVTFVPSFFFIFIAAPYIEALAKNARLQAALTGVTSAVVGVILNLALFFALHVLFPGGGGLDVFALIAALVSFVALWRFKTPIHILVPLGAVAGMLWKLYS